MKHDRDPKARWFITDEPVQEVDQDRFSHVDVADNLHAMIRGARPHERLMIGLLGPFGVGKSTVVQLLSKRMQDKDSVVLRISAERHEQTGLHSSLIFAFAEQLVTKVEVSRQLVEDELAALKFASAQTRVDLSGAAVLQLPKMVRRVTAIYPKLTRWLLIVVIVLCLAVLVAALTLGWGPIAQALAATGALAVLVYAAVPAAAVAGIGKWAQELIKPGSTTITRPRVQSADEFERAFAALVKLAIERGKKKLVIAVDDIDRLSPTEVLIGLNAIRSFQLTCDEHERPVFIVSADEDIIESAIKRSNPGPAAGSAGRGETAKAFVDRLFSHRQEMPVHAEADLTSYAQQLLSDGHLGATELGAPISNDVIEILIHDGVQDPRHVIRLLNAFFGDYRLASQRERQQIGSHSIRVGTVTSEPLTLARMTVLKLDFPRFHKALFDDDDLLRKLEHDISGEEEMSDAQRVTTGYVTQLELDRQRPSPGDEGGPSSNDPDTQRTDWIRLRNFVGRTTRIRPVDDLRPFLYLGQGEIDRVIGGREARKIRDGLINRQVADLDEQLSSIADAPDREMRLDAITQVVTHTIVRRHGIEQANAIETLTRVLDAIPIDRYSEIAVAVAIAFRNGAPTPLATDPLLRLAESAAATHDRAEIARQILSPNEGGASTGRDLVVLRGRLPLSQILGTEPVEMQIVQRIDNLKQSSLDNLGRWVIQWQETPWPDLADRFLTAVLAAVSGIEDDVPSDWREPIDLCFHQVADHAELESLDELHRHCISILNEGVTSELASIVLNGLLLLPSLSDAELLEAIHAGAVTAVTDEVRRKDVKQETWVHVLIISAKALDAAQDEASANLAANILTAYLSSHGDVVPADESLSLLAAVSGIADGSSVTPTTTLMKNWAAAATNDTGYGIDLFVNNASAEAANSLAVVATELTEALAATSPEPLQKAGRDVLGPMSQSEAGHAVLDNVLKDQIAKVQYNGKGLGLVVDVVTAVYSLPHYDPPQSLTNQLLEQCRTQAPYGGAGQRHVLSLLASVPWPDGTIDQAMEIVSSYVPNLTNDHVWDLLGQLARMPISIPTALRDMLIQALTAEGDNPPRASIATPAAANLPVDQAVSVALLLDKGTEIIGLVRPPIDTGVAISAALETLINNPNRIGLELTVRTLRLCAGVSPEAWSDHLGNLIATEVAGDAVAPQSVWADLIAAAVPPFDAEVLSRAIAAFEEDPPNSSSFTRAAIAVRTDVQDACIREILKASSAKERDRVEALATLLTGTSEARQRGLDGLRAKRGLASEARKILRADDA